MRAYCMLYGLAAGDRNGGPVRMGQRLGASLTACGGLDTADLGARWLDWWNTDAFDTGPVFAAVLSRVAKGESFEQAAQAVDRELGGLTAGVNAAHRAAPLAACFAIPDGALAESARRQARLTHWHPLAGDTAAALVLLCRVLINGRPWREALAWTKRELGQATAGVPLAIAPATDRSGFAPGAFASALWFVDRGGDFDEALRASLEFAGPANYCPVLVGVIAGARWGDLALARKLTP